MVPVPHSPARPVRVPHDAAARGRRRPDRGEPRRRCADRADPEERGHEAAPDRDHRELTRHGPAGPARAGPHLEGVVRMRPPVADPSTARRLRLSATEVAASALAAVSGAVAASSLGVAGTVVGAALASGLSTAGAALYEHVLRRTHDRLRVAPPEWRRVAMTAVVAFALAMGVITLGERVLGRSTADTIRGTPWPSAPAIVQLIDPRHGAHSQTPDSVPAPPTSRTSAVPTTSVTPTSAVSAWPAPTTTTLPIPTTTPSGPMTSPPTSATEG